MSSRALVFVMSFAALASGCVMPAAAPPLRTEGAYGVAYDPALSTERATQEERLSIGAHVASAMRHEAFPMDLGAGWVLTHAEGRTINGAYGEVARGFRFTDEARGFLGGRGEVLFPEAPGLRPGYSLLGRGEVEIFGHVAGAGETHDKKFFAGAAGYGVFALGAYAESGLTTLPGGAHLFVATFGLALRTPAFAAVSIVSK